MNIRVSVASNRQENVLRAAGLDGAACDARGGHCAAALPGADSQSMVATAMGKLERTTRPVGRARLTALRPARYISTSESRFSILEMAPACTPAALGLTSVDKALEICEVLGTSPGGMSLTELARLLKQPRPTVHRLLGLLKRRGYVRQEEDTQRYSLTLKLLDLCFRQLGRSDLRLHAYPVLREYVLRAGQRAFIAVPSLGEVTYLWSTGSDEIAMRTVYGREMPAHCVVYFSLRWDRLFPSLEAGRVRTNRRAASAR